MTNADKYKEWLQTLKLANEKLDALTKSFDTECCAIRNMTVDDFIISSSAIRSGVWNFKLVKDYEVVFSSKVNRLRDVIPYTEYKVLDWNVSTEETATFVIYIQEKES